MLTHYRRGSHTARPRWSATKARPVLRLIVLGLMTLSIPVLATPPGTTEFVASGFDVIAHGEDANVGAFSVFVNAEEVDDGWNVQIRAEGGIDCYWEGVTGDHFTETSGEVGVQTDSPDSSDDCAGDFMHVWVYAEFVTTTSQAKESVRDDGLHCVGTRASADYFEATVVVTHDVMAEPVEIVTTDTHYWTMDGFCHATGTPGSPEG